MAATPLNRANPGPIAALEDLHLAPAVAKYGEHAADQWSVDELLAFTAS